MLPATQKALLLESPDSELILSSTWPVPTPAKGELLVRVLSVALNPVDWKMKKFGFFIKTWPVILGGDIAGEVVQVGEPNEASPSFAVGDHVVFGVRFGNNRRTGFQQYAIADAGEAFKIPTNVSCDGASTMPIALHAAYIGLYDAAPHGMGLQPPLTGSTRGIYAGKAIVVLGGSSSVGQLVIQLARLSGFSPIIATCSPKHNDFVRSLGATHILDRYTAIDKAAVENLTNGAPIEVVFDAISLPETQVLGLDLLSPGGQLALDLAIEPGVRERAEREGKKVVTALGGPQVPHDVDLTALLEARDLKPNRVEILPGGLSGIPDGLRRLERNEVSAIKLIVRPQETT